MIDLSQLMSMQSTVSGVSNSSMPESGEAENPEAQEALTFMALLSECLVQEESANTINSSSSDANSTIPSELEKLPIEEIAADETEVATSGEMQTEDDGITELDVVENSPLQWFSTSSFEPPVNKLTENIDASKSDVTNTPMIETRTTQKASDLPVAEYTTDQEQMPVADLASTNEESVAAMEMTEAEASNEPLNLINIQDSKKDMQRKTTDSAKAPETAQSKILPEKYSENLIKESNNLSYSQSSKVESPVIEQTGDGKSTNNPPVLLGAGAASQDLKNAPVNDTGAPKMLHLGQKVASTDWGDKFNQQIIWLGQQKLKTAIIKLNPQELGPVEVNIKLIKDVTTVNITTHSTQVRDLIEQTLPRLREMMSEQGVNLSQVNVESSNKQHHSSSQTTDQFLRDKETEEESVQFTTQLNPKSKGIVDYFA